MNDLESPRPAGNPLAAFGLVLGVFVAAFLAGRALPESMRTQHPWAGQAVTQGLMAFVALGAMSLSRRRFSEFGFRRPAPTKGHFKLWGLALGAASTSVILVLGLRGMRGLAAYGLPGLILWIWIISSTVEEVFCRGWFQSLVAGPDENNSHGARKLAPIIWSAALFGTIHFPLLFAGLDIVSAIVIVLSVTALGYVCATARARTRSLRPALAAHVLFNVGGFLAGVIYTIAYRLATGHLPSV